MQIKLTHIHTAEKHDMQWTKARDGPWPEILEALLGRLFGLNALNQDALRMRVGTFSKNLQRSS